MINKKNVLGKEPAELGTKDAIHVAIVSVRAGKAIRPGQRCGINEFREAVPDPKGIGVADPFLRDTIIVGQSFWLLINQETVPNVTHHWDMPGTDLTPPTREPVKNKYLMQIAADAGVTYEQLMDACATVVRTGEAVPYPGTMTAEEAEEKLEMNEAFAEWSDETGHEFENIGTGCCPEYVYPEELFKF